MEKDAIEKIRAAKEKLDEVYKDFERVLGEELDKADSDFADAPAGDAKHEVQKS